MNGYKIGIAVDIGADRVNPMRLRHTEGEAIIARWIEEEKDWVARCIELGFKSHGVRPEYGSSIEYKVTNMEDGSIRIEGSQNIEPDAQKRMDDEEKRRKVLDAVQKVGGVTMEQLRGESRLRGFVFCRFIAAKELYSRTCMSMSDIAELLGRDVKSVRYYMEMYEVNSRNFREFRELAGRIAGLLEGCGRSGDDNQGLLEGCGRSGDDNQGREGLMSAEATGTPFPCNRRCECCPALCDERTDPHPGIAAASDVTRDTAWFAWNRLAQGRK